MDYERSIRVPLAPAECFAFLADERHLLAWRDGLVAFRRLDDGAPDAAARRYAETLATPLGKRTMTVAVVADSANHAVSFDVVDGPVRPRGEMRLRSEGDGAELIYRVSYDTALPIVTPIDRIVFNALVASVDRSLDNVQRILTTTS